jgi:hypothetical protein
MRYWNAINAICREPPKRGGNGRQRAAGACLAAGKALPRGGLMHVARGIGSFFTEESLCQ